MVKWQPANQQHLEDLIRGGVVKNLQDLKKLYPKDNLLNVVQWGSVINKYTKTSRKYIHKCIICCNNFL